VPSAIVVHVATGPFATELQRPDMTEPFATGLQRLDMLDTVVGTAVVGVAVVGDSVVGAAVVGDKDGDIVDVDTDGTKFVPQN